MGSVSRDSSKSETRETTKSEIRNSSKSEVRDTSKSRSTGKANTITRETTKSRSTGKANTITRDSSKSRSTGKSDTRYSEEPVNIEDVIRRVAVSFSQNSSNNKQSFSDLFATRDELSKELDYVLKKKKEF